MAETRDDLIRTHWTMVGRLKDLGDQDSWQEFYQTYWKLIYGVAIKSGLSDAEAQDVVQETVISVAKKMAEFKADPGAGSFKGWLLLITQRRIADQFRKRPRENEGAVRHEEDTPTTTTLERIPDPASLNLNATWDEEWERNLLATALERVKRQVDLRQFQVYDLYVVKQWPATKVARTLGVNVGQVYLNKHRILRLIKKELKSLAPKMG